MKRKLILRQLLPLAAFVYLLLCNGPLWAHAKQENYVWLNVDNDAIVGRVELNANDVRDKLNIDIDALGSTRLEGLQAHPFLQRVGLICNSRTKPVDCQRARKLPYETLFGWCRRLVNRIAFTAA